MKISFTCTEEMCQNELEVEVSVTPYVPAQTYGPADRCYPAEGGDIEIEEGVTCAGKVLDEDGNFIRVCGRTYYDTSDIPKLDDLVVERIKDMKWDYDGPDTLEEKYGD